MISWLVSVGSWYRRFSCLIRIQDPNSEDAHIPKYLLAQQINSIHFAGELSDGVLSSANDWYVVK